MPTWPFLPHKIDNELLSSFLVRTSHQYGTTAYSFCSHHFGTKTAIWNRDIDRSAPKSLIQRISDFSALSCKSVEKMTLRKYELTTCLTGSAHSPIQGFAPWINAIGVYHRDRKRFGLQYCPKCLQESPGFLKSWRLSFVTICQSHQLGLLDRCPECRAPVIPHRNHMHTLNCHNCNFRLDRAPGSLLGKTSQMHSLINFQNKLFKALHGLPVNIGRQEIPGRDVLAGAHILLSALRQKRCSKYSQLDDAGVGAIELSDTSERMTVLLFMDSLLEGWPQSFRDLSRQVCLDQKPFSNHSSIPNWIDIEIKRLPIYSRKHRTRIKRSRSPLEELRSLQRRKPPGWRSQRASILMELAGKYGH
ncbi:TniQ family protein [Hahella ganghwensis]|uniref:TniQ family protein n=1 Tax=Hahella ganghwensis TaxID=286420 RepID=UPI0003A74ADD